MALSSSDQLLGKEDYVQELIRNNRKNEDEFSRKKAQTDRMADGLADFLQSNGYSAYSQSEKNLIANGCYDAVSHSTLLPHKTIAVLAGIGWIGKNNLLITNKLGCAISMCTVLTDAPILTKTNSEATSKCGTCAICKDICPVGAIKGINWDKSMARDERLDV